MPHSPVFLNFPPRALIIHPSILRSHLSIHLSSEPSIHPFLLYLLCLAVLPAPWYPPSFSRLSKQPCSFQLLHTLNVLHLLLLFLPSLTEINPATQNQNHTSKIGSTNCIHPYIHAAPLAFLLHCFLPDLLLLLLLRFLLGCICVAVPSYLPWLVRFAAIAVAFHVPFAAYLTRLVRFWV